MKVTKGIHINALPKACLERNPQLFRQTHTDVREPEIKMEPISISKTTDESKLNKLEAAWLAYMRCDGHQWIGIQCVTLKLADDTRYTPDFLVIDSDGRFKFFETKGFWRDDAKVKIKVAARMYPCVKFVIVQRVKGEWILEDVKP